MKKLSLMLALLLLVGMLAGCNSEEGASESKYTIPGYQVSLPAGEGWTTVEESNYDLEMTKDGITLYAMGFSIADFVDLPTAEDLYLECTDELLSALTEVSEKEAVSTYTKDSKSIMVALHSGKDGDTTKQYYCFMVDFGAETGTMTWIAFSAKADTLKKNKDSLKAIVDGMTCSAKASEMGDLTEDGLEFDENGELIVEETEPYDIPYETDPAPTTNPPEPTEEASPSETTPEETTATQPQGTEAAATEAATTPSAAAQ